MSYNYKLKWRLTARHQWHNVPNYITWERLRSKRFDKSTRKAIKLLDSLTQCNVCVDIIKFNLELKRNNRFWCKISIFLNPNLNKIVFDKKCIIASEIAEIKPQTFVTKQNRVVLISRQYLRRSYLIPIVNAIINKNQGWPII